MSRAIDIVREVAPRGKPAYVAAFEHGDGLLKQHEINTPNRLAHFLAQMMHECGGLRIDWEDMDYSASRLLEIFGVGKHSAAVTEEEALQLAHKPAAIAERVYGLGNPKKARTRQCQSRRRVSLSRRRPRANHGPRNLLRDREDVRR